MSDRVAYPRRLLSSPLRLRPPGDAAAPAPAPVQFSPPERGAGLSQGMQVALLSLRQSNEIAREVLQALRAQGASATRSDYDMLYINFFTTRDQPPQLTPAGAVEADRLAWQLAGQMGLHLIKRRDGNRFTTSTSCSCGWSASTRRSPNAEGNLGGYEAKHRRQVAEGTYRAPRSVDEIWDELVAQHGLLPKRCRS